MAAFHLFHFSLCLAFVTSFVKLAAILLLFNLCAAQAIVQTRFKPVNYHAGGAFGDDNFLDFRVTVRKIEGVKLLFYKRC